MKHIPFAIQYGKKMRERGNYPDGEANGPQGMVIHYTSGRWEKGLDSGIQTIEGGIKSGYTFLVIARTGELLQAHDVNKYGAHAGESAWRIKTARSTSLMKSVSDELIGVEMNNASELKKVKNSKTGKTQFVSWFDQIIDPSQVRYVEEKGTWQDPTKDPTDPTNKKYLWNCPTGYYHIYSPEQEDMLTRTIMWLYVNCESFKLENVVGHCEVSGKAGIGFWRKSDPGGALSMPLEAYRSYLIQNKNSLIYKYKITKAT